MNNIEEKNNSCILIIYIYNYFDSSVLPFQWELVLINFKEKAPSLSLSLSMIIIYVLGKYIIHTIHITSLSWIIKKQSYSQHFLPKPVTWIIIYSLIKHLISVLREGSNLWAEGYLLCFGCKLSLKNKWSPFLCAHVIILILTLVSPSPINKLESWYSSP